MYFAQEAYPTSQGYSQEIMREEKTQETLLIMKKRHAREWRDSELYKTDFLSLLQTTQRKQK